ncbi:retropepsin-like aspartic protease family protein [Alterinioella nitratireducens]|jgi:aspartyl protease family protein|uniref:retropepsin-like aspartic protease family protein n=1 Tax=Alterinioella nitratireducens TaxID=2735915 RepID=UPI000C629316|nr:TIGR02281 family clan AA aspartic protease [Alterinioella nitratireducens]MAX73949.1 TIGR02281 family clan AA aspartic protease [Nioella sp.]NPD20819.1 TIGR02281 family clan AA aspartic protease [Alterinioella nitratireducens]|tara:strand:+ start:319 stop:900 length:582 start_codon:yes stop_codon:yes gene_type:complete
MEKAEIASLIYLGLLAIALLGSLVSYNRHQIGRVAQYALIWGFIFVGAIASVGLWPELRNSLVPQQSVVTGTGEVVVPRAYDGHYYLTLDLNGVPTRFVIDTGASEVVLTPQDAGRAGIDVAGLNYNSRAMTANGMVQTASIRLDRVVLGDIEDRQVPAVVNGAPMQESLLGMSYLNRFDRIAIEDGQMVLSR